MYIPKYSAIPKLSLSYYYNAIMTPATTTNIPPQPTRKILALPVLNELTLAPAVALEPGFVCVLDAAWDFVFVPVAVDPASLWDEDEDMANWPE